MQIKSRNTVISEKDRLKHKNYKETKSPHNDQTINLTIRYDYYKFTDCRDTQHYKAMLLDMIGEVSIQ